MLFLQIYVERQVKETTNCSIDDPACTAGVNVTDSSTQSNYFSEDHLFDCSLLKEQLFDSSLFRLWRTGAVAEQYQSHEDGVADVSKLFNKLH